MARIKIIEHNEATGELLEIYNNLIATRGKLADVHKIQSLRPRSIVKHMDLYLEIMFSNSALSRADREMMAVVVSAANNCEYCQLHHAEALNHYWKNNDKINKLRSDYHISELDSRQLILCEFAHELTKNPSHFNEPNFIHQLKNEGLKDDAILDATLVISYFNFVNRMVLSLGLEADEQEIKGYKF